MIAPAFHQYLGSITTIDNAALKLALVEFTEQLHYSKNELIYPKGKIPHRISFLEQGNAVAIVSSNRNTQTFRFYTMSEIICPFGFFSNQSSPQSIMALNDCVITALSYNQMQFFLEQYPGGYPLINSIIVDEIRCLQLRINSLTQETPMQRYEAFLTTYKEISNLVKTEMIASYLNISYSTLSRLKEMRR